MVVNKNIVFLWIICLLLIILAMANKLSGREEADTQIYIEAYDESTPIETSSIFYEEEPLDTNTIEPVKTKPTPIVAKSPITAKSYLVGNVQTGEVYLQRNINTVLPVASMSKLITAVESIDQFSLSGTTTVNESNLNFPDSQTYAVGEIFTIEEALHLLLISSSNIIAETLASTTDRSKFMDLMSSYAWEIGMPATYFADPSGLIHLNMSSANDFFALARYLYKLRPDILSITKIPKYVLATTTEHGYREINSTHPFVSDKRFIGGKTGRTPLARDTMLTILDINNTPVAFIVLGSENRNKDTLYLIDLLQKQYKI